MNQEKIAAQILRLIIGEEEEKKLITKSVKEYNKSGKYSIKDAESIIDSYMIAILLIGFSKKKIDMNKYAIHFVNKPEIEIDAKKFSEDYKSYIDKVEDFKFELMRKLLQ